MSEQQRLQQERDQLEQRWKSLSHKLHQLETQRVLETRADEIVRLDDIINQDRANLTNLEAQLHDLEKILQETQKTALTSEARRLESNQAYPQAIDIWETLKRICPDDPQIAQELQRLQGLQQRAQLYAELIQQLSRYMLDIKSIYGSIVQRLKHIGGSGIEDVAVCTAVERFVNRDLTSEELLAMWPDLVADNMSARRDMIDFDFRALAERLQSGEIVLFLGSDIPKLFDPNVLDATAIAADLADKAKYANFGGSLSMIAEYYQMRPEYGRRKLIERLHDLLPKETVSVPLYKLLARIKPPLVLISSAYDSLLEKMFQSQSTPKKYVLITSLVGVDSDADVGKMLVHYSDKDAPELPCLQEDLSHMDFLRRGYSLIYKIRGYLSSDSYVNSHQYDAVTLSEENYFTFARHMDKLIPDYVVRQLIGRVFLCLGYVPTQWEDRLIANALLSQVGDRAELTYVIRKEPNRFEAAYWRRHGINIYEMELQEFVQRLEEYFA